MKLRGVCENPYSIAFFLMIGSISLPSPAQGETLEQTEVKVDSAGSPFPATADSVAQGRALFAVGCVSCHGAQGRGDGPAAIALEKLPRDLTDAEAISAFTDRDLFERIARGGDIMPSFAESYTEEEIWRIVHYVRTLSREE